MVNQAFLKTVGTELRMFVIYIYSQFIKKAMLIEIEMHGLHGNSRELLIVDILGTQRERENDAAGACGFGSLVVALYLS